MPKVLWTVFLVVALQGIAAAATSTAFASPTSEPVATTESVATETVAVPDRTTRLEASSLRIQPASRAETERKPPRTQPEVLSRNFANPKPVQIYWFFGGR